MKALKLYLENHIEDDLDIIENIKNSKGYFFCLLCII